MLFSPIRIGGLTAPSRIVRTAVAEGMCTPEGFVTSELKECYGNLGRSGAIGIIITGGASVAHGNYCRPGQIRADDDCYIGGLSELAAKISSEGSLSFLQLNYPCHGNSEGHNPITPSGWEPNTGTSCRPATHEDIEQVVNAFASAAFRAEKAGFHGIEIHAGHGFLLSQFLSPKFNHRTDSYGTDQKGRSRILLEIIQAIHASCGRNFCIGVRINGSDGEPDGLRPEDALVTGLLLQEERASFIDVSGNFCMNSDNNRTPMKNPRSMPCGETCYFEKEAAFLKEGLSIPVLQVGGIRSFDDCSRILRDGHADMIGMARPFICEPDIASRWRSGDMRPSVCTSCNGCLSMMRNAGMAACIRRIR